MTANELIAQCSDTEVPLKLDEETVIVFEPERGGWKATKYVLADLYLTGATWEIPAGWPIHYDDDRAWHVMLYHDSVCAADCPAWLRVPIVHYA